MRQVTAIELKVGLLIVAGLVATVALVLVSDRIRFERYYRVKAYLADAGGLRPKSPITLSGIRIGEVEKLATVNDPRGNIVVALKIEEEYRLPADATLTLSSSGIFGDSFLAFSGSPDPNAKLLPTDGSAEIKAGRGFLDKASQQAESILTGASDLLSGETRQDAKRLVKNAADLAEAGVKLAQGFDAQGKQLGEALSSIRSLADELHQTTQELAKRVDSTLDRFDHTLADVDAQTAAVTSKAGDAVDRIAALATRGDRWFESNGDELGKSIVSLRQLSERCARIAADIADGQGVLGQLVANRDLARDLNNTAIDLSRAASYIAEHPESLVFGATKEDAAKLRARRDREKVRRAFDQNYGGIPLQTATPAAVAPAAPIKPER